MDVPSGRENDVSAINWGLVAGKTQTVFPWAGMMKTADLSIPFHDVFNADGSLLVPDEKEVFNSIHSK